VLDNGLFLRSQATSKIEKPPGRKGLYLGRLKYAYGRNLRNCFMRTYGKKAVEGKGELLLLGYFLVLFIFIGCVGVAWSTRGTLSVNHPSHPK